VVSGDRLVVTSDDPEALALVQQLVRALTADNAAADFTVIRLKNARAADAAKILDELYNGPTQQPNLPPAAFGFLRPGSTAPAAGQRPTRIRVVADSGSNSLLVRARPLDLLGIQHLLASAIDVAETDSAAVQRTWVLRPLKHADAGEVARTLRDVYRVQMSNGGAAPGTASTTPFGGPALTALTAARAGDPAARAPSLSVGVDERTQTLIVACSERMKDEIQELVDKLDEAAGGVTPNVQVIHVTGADPALVQRAIDAIQGRTPVARQATPAANGLSPTNGGGRQGMSGGFGAMAPGAGGFGQRGAGPGGGTGYGPGSQFGGPGSGGPALGVPRAFGPAGAPGPSGRGTPRTPGGG
jgi:hypothetical protein